MSNPEIERTLLRNEIFSALPVARLRYLASVAVLQKLSRKDALILPKGSLSVIGFGLIKTEYLGPSFIVGLTGPGEILELLADESTRMKQHSVLTDTATLIHVKRADLFFEISPPSALAIAFSLQKVLTHTTERLLSTFHVRAEIRLAQVMLDLLDRFGDEREDGTFFISLRLSRSDLASLSGTTVETAIRTMTVWKKAGLMTTDDEGFQIRSRDELRKVSGV